MKPPNWRFFPFKQPRQSTPEPRLNVSNLTRASVLATSMEVADTGTKRNKGLLGRKRLSPGEGLWIIPCESVHTFGMQFAIDLIYLDRNNRIKKLRQNVVPWRVSACLSAHSVLELPSGTIRETQTQLEDTLEFNPSSVSNQDMEGKNASSASK